MAKKSWLSPTQVAVAAVAVGGGLLRTFWTSKEAASGEDQDIALFTHADHQLHCLDRELRHPCVKELRHFIDVRSDEEAKAQALSCIEDVLKTSQDFWELKNMTHLLLDLDTVDHVFDQGGRQNEFVKLGLRFAEKLIEHQDCLSEFDRKGELECRCVPLYGKVARLKYVNAGMLEEAKAIYERVRQTAWQGSIRSYAAGEAVPWDDFQHTPQIWARGLRSQPIWPREQWDNLPICKQFEDNFQTIREEVVRALRKESDVEFEDAYRFLYAKGEWNRVMLYHGRKFTDECEAYFPKTCALLKQWLPSKPGLPWTSDQNEQVMVIKMKPGTDTELHSGPANNILNIHLGLSGVEGAKLIIANQTYEWEEGKVIAWDGSYDHRVHCIDCTQDRVIIMARYMHPEMGLENYRGWKKTQFEAIPEEMQ